MSKLPPTWRGLVFYSAKNRELVTTGLRAWEAMGRLTLVPFPGPAGSSPDFVFTRDFANSMMLNADFYRALPFDKFLLVQLDAMVCRRDWSNETGLGRFVQWDYIGAPWLASDVGNGGFSWRSKAVAIALCERIAAISAAQKAESRTPTPSPLPDGFSDGDGGRAGRLLPPHLMFERRPHRHPNVYDTAEDKIFSYFLGEVGGRVAPGDVALAFAIESWPWQLPPAPPVAPWGVHNVWPYQVNWREAILPNCPGLDLLQGLKPRGEK